MNLPPFPVDDETLNLLDLALYPQPPAVQSSVWNFLQFMSEMGGSDSKAVEEQIDEQTVMLRDPQYHIHDVVHSLIEEIRRLRKERT